METAPSQEINALKLISKIATELKASELKPAKLKKITSDLMQLSEYMELTESQTLVFTTVFALYVNDTHTILTQLKGCKLT